MKPASGETPGPQTVRFPLSQPFIWIVMILGLGLLLSLAMLAAGTLTMHRLAVPHLAQSSTAVPSPVDPLPPDTGAAGLKQMLVRLQTTARLMQTTAHPDD